MIDANTYYLNKYLDEQERTERAYESFLDDIESYLSVIEVAIEEIFSIAKNYEYGDREYDFYEDAKEWIKDLL